MIKISVVEEIRLSLLTTYELHAKTYGVDSEFCKGFKNAIERFDNVYEVVSDKVHGKFLDEINRKSIEFTDKINKANKEIGHGDWRED